MPQVKAALHKHAESMADTAESTLLVHRRTGDAHIETLHAGDTDLDSYVMLVADSKAAALSIENGHKAKNADGDVYWEPGIHALSSAVKHEKRKRTFG